LTQSQKGALEKFIVSKPRDVVENLNNVIELDDTNKNDQPSNVEELSDNNKNEDLVDDRQNNVEELSINNINEDLVNDQQNNAEELGDNDKNESAEDSIGNEKLVNDQQSQSIPFNVYDPRNWDNLDTKSRYLLVEKGPIRDKSYNDVSFPLDQYSRHFSLTHYTRILSNGEKQDRNWLVYSRGLDKVFCFCCKLFKSDQNNNRSQWQMRALEIGNI
jgi:hypothetical protein